MLDGETSPREEVGGPGGLGGVRSVSGRSYPWSRRSGSVWDPTVALRESAKALGPPGPVTHQRSRRPQGDRPVFFFLLGPWRGQLREQGLGANCKFGDSSGASAGALGQGHSLQEL